MGMTSYQAVYGIDRHQLIKAAEKAGFDDEDIELIFESDVTDGLYNGNARECSSDYLGVEIYYMSGEDGKNFIDITKLAPQGMDTARKAKEFNDLVDKLKAELVENGVDEAKVNKLRFDKPRSFLACGYD